MLLFNQRQDHVILSFLSGHVLFMNAQTRKPEACLSMGKNVHAVWSTADQKMTVAANIAEKTFIRTWTDYAAHKFSFSPEKDMVNLAALENGGHPDTAPICPITESTPLCLHHAPWRRTYRVGGDRHANEGRGHARQQSNPPGRLRRNSGRRDHVCQLRRRLAGSAVVLRCLCARYVEPSSIGVGQIDLPARSTILGSAGNGHGRLS